MLKNAYSSRDIDLWSQQAFEATAGRTAAVPCLSRR